MATGIEIPAEGLDLRLPIALEAIRLRASLSEINGPVAIETPALVP